MTTTVPQPSHGATGWDVYLQAVIADYEARLHQLELTHAVLRSQFSNGDTDISVPSGGVQLPWVPRIGPHHDNIFDLSDPLNPVALAAGYLRITGNVIADDNAAGKAAFVELDIDAHGEDPLVTGAFSLDPAMVNRNALLALEYYVPAGGVITLYASHNAVTNIGFRHSFNVVFTPE